MKGLWPLKLELDPVWLWSQMRFIWRNRPRGISALSPSWQSQTNRRLINGRPEQVYNPVPRPQ